MHDAERPAVEVAQPVDVGEAGEDLARQLEDHVERPRVRVTLAQVREVEAADLLEGEEVGLVDAPELVELHHVRVVEPRGDARLGQEQRLELVVLAQGRADALQHHHALDVGEAALAGEEDLPHPALGDLLHQQVFAEALHCGSLQYAIRAQLRYRPTRARTTTPAAARPNAPVTKPAVP